MNTAIANANAAEAICAEADDELAAADAAYVAIPESHIGHRSAAAGRVIRAEGESRRADRLYIAAGRDLAAAFAAAAAAATFA